MLDTKYNHDLVEEGKYEKWLNKNYFKCDENSSKKHYSIVLPPPNVTGVLHLGHAWDTTLQDIMIRYKKMEGYDCLWLPGMDHAAIATEAKVVKRLKDNGINKYEYGREKFLDSCWDWTHEHGDIIRKQWAIMGFALDYSKERFTLDEEIATAVKKVFVDYYNEGLEEENKISIENFDANFGSVLLNVRRTPIDTNTEDAFMILGVIGIMVIFIVQIIVKIAKHKVQKYINKNGYREELIHQLDDCVEEKHYKDKIILTKNFLVDLKSTNCPIFNYDDVKWVHIHNVKYYGVLIVSSSIIVHLKDGKTQMGCVEIKGKTTDEFLEIFNKICEKAPADCLKGYTKENLQEFKKYKKEI